MQTNELCWMEWLVFVLFWWRLGGRKTNFHLNLFYLHLYFYHSSLSLTLFLWNMDLASLSPKDQLTWNQKLALFIFLRSWARNRNLSFVLAPFLPITHVLCHFNIDWLKFTSQVYDVYKHIHKQFTFSWFNKVRLCHTVALQYLKPFNWLIKNVNYKLFIHKWLINRIWC